MDSNTPIRLDQYLVDRGLAETRNKAVWMIEQGWVSINGKAQAQKSFRVSENDMVVIVPNRRIYVSQGGYKLEKALVSFNIDLNDKTVLDIGASTGGFTDCALQHGAQMVVAVDIGEGQLHPTLQKNPKVISLEKTDIRTLDQDLLPVKKFDLILVDVSFISLEFIFSHLADLLAKKGMVIALLKPQFEQKERRKHKGGIIKHEKVRLEAIERVQEHILNHGFSIQQMVPTDADGKEKNIEYLLLLIPQKTA